MGLMEVLSRRMIKSGRKIRRYWGLVLVILINAGMYVDMSAQRLPQSTVLEGRVIDAQTNEAVPFAALISLKTGEGTVTDESGAFSLKLSAYGKIKFSCVGYHTDTIRFLASSPCPVVIRLAPKTMQLREIVVKSPKVKYRSKGNPAVELMEKVIAHKAANRQGTWNYLEYRKYEKIIFGISNFTSKFNPDKTTKDLRFLFNHTDTMLMKGKKILPLYIQEKTGEEYFSKNPSVSKEVLQGIKSVDYGKYFDMQGISSYLKNIYETIDLYDNDISFLTNQFVSPIATMAPSFYKYFIMDTLVQGNTRCVRLYFSPRNKTDMLFQGDLYITLDSCYAVKQADITVNKEVNLNWIKEVDMSLNYERDPVRGWLLTSDVVGIDFGLSKSEMGVFGQRSTEYFGYRSDFMRSPGFYKSLQAVNDSVDLRSDRYWTEHRPRPLTATENDIYSMVDSLNQVPVFKRVMNLANLLMYGYVPVGKLAIGSIYTFLGYNPVEGYRAQFGGKTTSRLSPHFNIAAYAAYGFHDQTVKYSVSGAVGLNSKSIYQFPANYLKVNYQYDAKTPGNELSLSQSYNFIAALTWGTYDKFFYNRIFQVEQLHEYSNHFSYAAGFRYVRETPRGTLYFNYSDYGLHRNDEAYLPVSELYCRLRFAPGEKFYQEQLNRYYMSTFSPVVELACTMGSRAIGNRYNYQKVRLTVSKRFRLSVLGYSDVTLEGAQLFGTVPYSLLFIHPASQTYFFEDAKYNLMNFLEFVSDRYTALNINHSFNGFFLNKIPFLKKMNLREAVTCKVLYGDVARRNNPDYNTDLFRFPENSDGRLTTYHPGNTPYVEVSAGIGNILRIFRVDFVKRLTWLDNPDISAFGLRFSMKMDF